MRKIVIAGGSGFLGQLLASHYSRKGVEVVILSRRFYNKNRTHVRYEHWDGETLDRWVNALENADVLINLSGKSVNCRYTGKNRKRILDSRVYSTAVLGEAINICERPPALWINSSSATIYQHEEQQDMDEKNGITGDGFSVDVCKMWEQTFLSAKTPVTRKIILRSALVLDTLNGALHPLSIHVYAGMGGRQGSGKQYVSWLHKADFLGIIDFLIDHPQTQGIYNATAPVPVPNAQFMEVLRINLGIPIAMPVPAWLLEIGAWVTRTEAELILKSRRVVPARLLEEGYQFRFADIEKALEDLFKKSKITT